MFLKILKAEKIPVPVKEFQFCERKWRFDYAYPDIKLAIECEGGVFIRGRHTRGSGFLKDMEKYNRATLLGWKLLRYSPDQLLTDAVDDLKEFFKVGISGK